MTLTRWLMAGLLTVVSGFAYADEFSDRIAAIKAVQREGNGNEAAGAAARALSSGAITTLIPLLAAFDDASPLAANYLRGSVEGLVDRQIAAKAALPSGDLEAFVLDLKRDPRGRRLAYETLRRVDPAAEGRLIPKMLLDPSSEFRRDAVALYIKQAKAAGEGKKDESVELYRKALSGATEEDQVKDISAELKKLGEKVDLQKHFGFMTKWRIIGPFDNKMFIGFDAVYAPEKSVDLGAKLQGQMGEVSWGEIATADEFGILDVAKSVAPHKGAVMYLATTFQSNRDQQVEVRLGTPNAWKIWVNGQFVFGRDEYHRGMAIDQYRVKASLKAGDNVILVKLCQNEQTEDWAQRYQLQLRVSDSSGIAIPQAARTAGLPGRVRAAVASSQ